jgi:pimeloyl-ACP methyl ester carboxylesterase
MGSFHVGGRVVEISGKPVKEVTFTPGGVPAKVDPNGTYQVEQMYVQYFLPANEKGAYPLLMWHGGGLTGVTYETTPDGREGWLNYFLRKGWAVYNSDAVERGRSGWTSTFKGDAVFLPFGDPWERFRIGPPGSWNEDKAKRATYPGTQFPTDAYEQFMKQGVPRWLTTDDRIVAAYLALVDKVCPCVVLVHSQSGAFGYAAALKRPDKVKALVIVEGTIRGDATTAATLKNVPIMVPQITGLAITWRNETLAGSFPQPLPVV